MPLLIGVFIYLFLRKGTFLNHVYMVPKEFDHMVDDNSIISFIRFNLPDFLWAYSLTAALVFWQRKNGKINDWFLIIILLLIAATELVQFYFPERFTLDWLDIVAALLGSLLSYFLIKKGI